MTGKCTGAISCAKHQREREETKNFAAKGIASSCQSISRALGTKIISPMYSLPLSGTLQIKDCSAENFGPDWIRVSCRVGALAALSGKRRENYDDDDGEDSSQPDGGRTEQKLKIRYGDKEWRSALELMKVYILSRANEPCCEDEGLCVTQTLKGCHSAAPSKVLPLTLLSFLPSFHLFRSLLFCFLCQSFPSLIRSFLL